MGNDFASRLKELLKEKKVSQNKYASLIGVSNTCVSYWITNKRQPSADNIIMTAQYFNVTTDYILGVSDKKSY